MCGILGYCGPSSGAETIWKLQMALKIRGLHSFGISFYDRTGLTTVKRDAPFTLGDIKAALNTSSNLRRAQYGNVTMAGWIRHIWNSPKMGASLAKMYGPLLKPIAREQGDIVYKYVGPK